MRHLPKRINDHIYHAWLWSLAIFKLVKPFKFYYQNIRGLTAKDSELLSNVYSSKSHVIFWPKRGSSFCDSIEISSQTCTLFIEPIQWALKKMRGGGTFIPASVSVSGVYVEMTWKWLRNVFGLQFFLPVAVIYVSATTVLILTQLRTLRRYFSHLDHVLYIHNFRVLLLEDFNLPLFEWKLGIHPAISHYYNKLRGETIFSST